MSESPMASPGSEDLPVTSSTPTDVPEEQAALFREVLPALEQRRVPYAVSGAFALRAHTGICRFTKDLDLFMTAKTSREVFPYLRERGFDCAVCDPVWLAKARKGEFFVDMITGMSNGVIVVEDSWIERASPAMVHQVRTRVLAPEELVASKIFVAKRERFDGADIAHVIYGTYGSFDWERELQLVGEQWEMLVVAAAVPIRISGANPLCPRGNLALALAALRRSDRTTAIQRQVPRKSRG
jgi:hypothetical protein